MRGSEPREGPVPGQAGLIQIPQEPRDMDTPVKHDAAVTAQVHACPRREPLYRFHWPECVQKQVQAAAVVSPQTLGAAADPASVLRGGPQPGSAARRRGAEPAAQRPSGPDAPRGDEGVL